MEVVEPAPPAPVEEHAPGTNGFATPVEIKRIRQLPAFYHNWSDLFFIMDVMSGGVDICDILIFISKTDDLIPIMDDKKVDVHLSRLDVATNTLTVSYTDAGIIEKLLGKSESIRYIQELGRSTAFQPDLAEVCKSRPTLITAVAAYCSACSDILS